MKILNISEENQQQAAKCVSSVYRIFDSIRYGRLKEAELLSALLYGGLMPAQMVAKLESTLIHYTVMDAVALWSENGKLSGNATWLPAHQGSKEKLVGWNVDGQNVKFSRVNSFLEVPRSAENRKESGRTNDQLSLFEDFATDLSGIPQEIQLLHMKTWDNSSRQPGVRVWGIALKENGTPLANYRQMIHEGPIRRTKEATPIEEDLADFSIKDTGIFDRAIERVQSELTG